MNLMTKFELGDIVSPILDPTAKMQITKIIIFLDGGYQYEATRFYDGQLTFSSWFEGELEDK